MAANKVLPVIDCALVSEMAPDVLRAFADRLCIEKCQKCQVEVVTGREVRDDAIARFGEVAVLCRPCAGVLVAMATEVGRVKVNSANDLRRDIQRFAAERN